MSIKKFINSFKYAFSGLRKVFKEEQNFRVQFCIGAFVILASIFVFNFSYIEIALTLICVALVMIVEVINTAIENTWDHLEPNHHPVVKSVKDMMAGAVVLASAFSAIVWILLIYNHFN